ncbi:MAG: COG1470 family protein, partial [Candidatus Helarchaeales archaeon]
MSSESGNPDLIQGNTNITVLRARVGNGNVNFIELLIDNTQVYTNESPSFPLTWIWDSATVQNGTHKLQISTEDDGDPIVSCIHEIPINVQNVVNATELIPEDPVSAYLEVEIGQNATYLVYYNNTNYNESIPWAAISTDWGWNYIFYDWFNGSYSVEIQETEYAGIGVYTIQIQAFRPHFEAATLNVTLNVTAKMDNNTELISYDPFDGYQIADIGSLGNFTVYYNNTEDNIGIEGASIQTNWTRNWTVNDVGSGYYNLSFETDISPGNYTIMINASKTGEQTATLYVVLNVTGQMNLVVDLVKVEGLYPEIPAMLLSNVTFQIEVNDSLTNASVSNANISILHYSGTWSGDSNGLYNITIFGNAFTEYGEYFVNLTVSAPDYESKSIIVGIAIRMNVTSGPASSPPVINGYGDAPSTFLQGSTEWSSAGVYNYSLFMEDVSGIEKNYTFTILIMNDENYLYFGYEIPDDMGWDGTNYTNADGFAVASALITGNETDDLDVHAVYGFDIYDWFINSSFGNDPLNDTEYGGTNDTQAFTDWFSLYNHAEMQVPLNSSDTLDWALTVDSVELFEFHVSIYEVLDVLEKNGDLFFNGYLTLANVTPTNNTQLDCVFPSNYSLEINQGENATFWVFYNDTDHGGIGVYGAVITTNWTHGFTYSDMLNGNYSITFYNTTGVLPGSYNISILANKTGYDSASCIVTLTIATPPKNTTITPILPANGSIEIFVGENATYTLFYNNTDDALGIDGAMITTNWTQSSQIINDLGNGNYTLLIYNTTFVPSNSYIIEVNASKIGYKLATCYLILDLKKLNTTELYSTSSEIQVVSGDPASLMLYYNDTDSNQGIPNATLTFNWTHGHSIFDLGNGYVNVTLLNTSIPGPGIYIIEFNASKDGYQDASCHVTINITSPPDSIAPYWINSTVDPPSPIVYSKGLTITFNCTWQDNVAVQTVLFELNGTNNTVSTVINDTYMFTVSDMPAGQFTYRWWASDFAGNWNYTNTSSYTIMKNASSTTLYLDSLDNDIQIAYNHSLNITASVSLDGNEIVNVSILINGTQFYLGNTSESWMHVFNKVGV